MNGLLGVVGAFAGLGTGLYYMQIKLKQLQVEYQNEIDNLAEYAIDELEEIKLDHVKSLNAQVALINKDHQLELEQIARERTKELEYIVKQDRRIDKLQRKLEEAQATLEQISSGRLTESSIPFSSHVTARGVAQIGLRNIRRVS